MLARWLCALALTLVCGATCRAADRDADLPGEFVVTPMAQDLRLNGLPLRIALLATSLSPPQACARITEHWARSGRVASLGCWSSGGWWLATACTNFRELTVQLRPGHTGSSGYLSSIDLRGRTTAAPTPRMPIPRGAQVRSVVQSAGTSGDVLQFTVGLPISPTVALRRITAYAAQGGWKLTSPPQPRNSGQTFELRRGQEFARGFLTRDDAGSALVLLEGTVGWSRP